MILRFDCFYLLNNIKSLYVSYWPFIYIDFFSLLKYLIQDRIFYATAYRRHSSRKWQREIIVCFVCCKNTVILLHRYIVFYNLFYFINIFLGHNLYWFFRYHSKAGKFIFVLEQFPPLIWLILFFDVLKVIVYYLSFTFSIIWFKTNYLLTLQPSSIQS